MNKRKNGTQNEPRSPRGTKDIDNVDINTNEHTGSKGGSEEGENKSIGSSGEIDSGEFSIKSLQETFFDFTGKMLRGLLNKSENDKRVWEDRLQEAKDCIIWYQNLLEKCEKEISISESQITEVKDMISQIEEK